MLSFTIAKSSFTLGYREREHIPPYLTNKTIAPKKRNEKPFHAIVPRENQQRCPARKTSVNRPFTRHPYTESSPRRKLTNPSPNPSNLSLHSHHDRQRVRHMLVKHVGRRLRLPWQNRRCGHRQQRRWDRNSWPREARRRQNLVTSVERARGICMCCRRSDRATGDRWARGRSSAVPSGDKGHDATVARTTVEVGAGRDKGGREGREDGAEMHCGCSTGERKF